MRPRPHLLVRSTLTSVAFLLLVVPALAALGGYLPRLPAVGTFGRLLNTDLPWLVVGPVVALGLALTAVRLGGRRFTQLLASAAFVTLAANAAVGVHYVALATDHGASYDLLRQARPPEAFTRQANERVTFATVDGVDLRADVWRPEVPAGTGVLFIHGGAFTHGELGLRPRLFALFADHGATVLDVEYRLSPPPRWQEARADVLCALGWFQANAERFGVDPEKIIVMGDSAGGNLAMVAGYAPSSTGGEGLVDPSCNVDPRSPAGVIALYPTADLVATWEDVKALGDPAPFPEAYTGGTPTQVPDRYRDASVQALIQPGLAVPTLLITGANDGLVTISRVRALAMQLRSADVAVELIEVPFADHAFDGAANGFGFQLEETVLPEFLEEATR